MSLRDDIKSHIELISPYLEQRRCVDLLEAALMEIDHLAQLIDEQKLLTGHDHEKTFDWLARLKNEKARYRELLNRAAGLLYRLEEHKCISTDDEVFAPELEHWRHVGRDLVREATQLLNSTQL